jgi:hypothetical protein
MTNEEITAVLRANVAKTVKVIYRDGDTALALVQSVDDEGFVYDLAYLSGPNAPPLFGLPSQKLLTFSLCRRLDLRYCNQPGRNSRANALRKAALPRFATLASTRARTVSSRP